VIEQFFEMSSSPFSRDIPIKELYDTLIYQEVQGRLEYAAEKQLFAVLTADVGCGKTTAIRRFADSLDKSKYQLLYVVDSKLTPRWFYKGLLEQLGVEAKFYRGDAKRQLHKELEVIQGIHRKKVVCIVDEAHLLDKETLEEIRFLLNYQMDSVSPMALILVGQNELWDKLKLQKYSAIRQRLDMKCELPQLDRSQMGEYIKRHMDSTGCPHEVFTEKATDEIYRYTAGSPRAVNKLCIHCLLYAAQRARKLIDDHMIREVIAGEMP